MQAALGVEGGALLANLGLADQSRFVEVESDAHDLAAQQPFIESFAVNAGAGLLACLAFRASP
jgi:hypothetical protein